MNTFPDYILNSYYCFSKSLYNTINIVAKKRFCSFDPFLFINQLFIDSELIINYTLKLLIKDLK